LCHAAEARKAIQQFYKKQAKKAKKQRRAEKQRSWDYEDYEDYEQIEQRKAKLPPLTGREIWENCGYILIILCIVFIFILFSLISKADLKRSTPGKTEHMGKRYSVIKERQSLWVIETLNFFRAALQNS